MSNEFDHYSEVVSSQRSTEFVMAILGIKAEAIKGQSVLDLGSGYRQQLARDLEAMDAQVTSLDPNLPHTDEYVLDNARTQFLSNPL